MGSTAISARCSSSNHVNRIAEHPYTPASYAVLSKTRVVFIAVLIYERGAMMHR